MFFIVDDIMLNIFLLIYIVLNAIATYKMYKCEDRDTKVGLGCLPLPLLILVVGANYLVIKYIIGFENMGADEGDAYGMGLSILGANLMVIAYIVNIIVYRYSKMKNKKNDDKNKK